MEQVGIHRQAVIETVTRPQGAGRLPVAVVIGLAAVPDIEPLGIGAARIQTEPAALAAPRDARRGIVGPVPAIAETQRRFDVTAPLAGEDPDHPAHGLRAVQAGARTTHHLDAPDLLDGNMLERGGAQGRRTHFRCHR
uniref:Uncharacterized protein n=1 Tax=Candidatus Kentrum eta TaxID=2126337 RepID=A0A450URC0_9GAMM|nr:MAG: hypothetical protein BECKH772B_GA0070898_1007010 [Candidatus Kentron sp. H]VFK01492.1 MAG: hypothetical protein BECKH772C_GA0070978_1006710 [Candidatus Kentron sp. H]